MVTTFIFDIGNVVWNYQDLLGRLLEKWASLSGLPLEEFKNHYLAYYKFFETNEKTLDDFVLSLNQSDPLPYYQALSDIYREEEFNKHLNQPLLRLINNLRSVIKVGYLSNAENFYYPHIHQRIKSNFDFGYCSWELGLEKPNPEIFQKVLSLENIKPSEIIFIDDTEINIKPAQSLGINAILYQNNQQLLSELRQISL